MVELGGLVGGHDDDGLGRGDRGRSGVETSGADSSVHGGTAVGRLWRVVAPTSQMAVSSVEPAGKPLMQVVPPPGAMQGGAPATPPKN